MDLDEYLKLQEKMVEVKEEVPLVPIAPKADYLKMKLKELQALALDQGLEVGGLTKSEIISILQGEDQEGL